MLPKIISDKKNVPAGVRKGVYKVSAGVHKGVHGHIWTAKAGRFYQRNRVWAVKLMIVVLFLAAGIIGTLTEVDGRYQTIAYMLAAGTGILLDPLQAVYRYLAMPGRAFVFGWIFLVVIYILYPTEPYERVVVMLGVLLVVIIKTLNRRWLLAENWLLSPAAEKALTADPDSKHVNAWESHGFRECRTVLHQLGLPADDDTVLMYAKPTFIVGYVSGRNQYSSIKAERDRMERDMQQAEESAAAARAALTDYQNRYASKLDMINDYETMQYRYASMEKEYNQICRINEQLVATNEELLTYIPDPAEAAEAAASAAKTERELIIEELQRGSSIRATAQAVGIPKCRVEKVKRELDQAAAEQQAGIIHLEVQNEDRYDGSGFSDTAALGGRASG